MKKEILYIFRSPGLFYSIENIFKSIAQQLTEAGKWKVKSAFLPFKGFNWSVIQKNRRFIRSQQADCYHITGDVHYAALFLPKEKTVLTIHDCVFMYQSSGIKRWILKKLLLDWPVARCRAITTISDQTRRDIMRFTGCEESRIRIIRNPVGSHFTQMKHVFRQHKPQILFIGTTPNKNLPRAIEALQGIPCTLHIVGQITEAIQALLEKNAIEYRGFIHLNDQEMANQYIDADLVLFPTTFEGFGMPILEAHQSGRPVITSDLSPMKEVAGIAACLVDPFDIQSIRSAIVKVTGDACYRDELIAAGLANVKAYSLKAVTEQYEQVYEEIVNEKPCVA